MINMEKQRLIEKLKSVNFVKKGNFTLKSGIESDLYFDFKGLVNYPDIIFDISNELSKFINNKNTIAGVPMGAIPYACAVSQITKLPMILIRENKKDYGLQKQIDGEIMGKVVLIEDVMTTGKSLLETIELLIRDKIEIEKILIILDRGNKINIFKGKEYAVECLFCVDDFM